MNDKQMERLLDGFVASAQSLTVLQEGILSLHEVMEKFHKATENFALKSEMDTLVPTIKEQFSQVDTVYTAIAIHLKKTQEDTLEIQQIGQEMVPAYQKLQKEVQELKEMQGEMAAFICEISSSFLEMNVMQKELQVQMKEYGKMMEESRKIQEELRTITEENVTRSALTMHKK